MTIAARLEQILAPVIAGPLPVRLIAWDGSEAGPTDGPRVFLNSPQAIQRLIWHPGELGAAQAYVTGEIDIDGDLDAALTHVWSVVAQRQLDGIRPGPATLKALAQLLREVNPGLPPTAPATQARVRGRLHTRLRDRSAIAHHYDLSNEFYDLLMDDSMAYSCAWWSEPRSASYTLADAQRDKLDRVIDKLQLSPGQRMLDVGCGWGSLSLRAAERGLRVTGVTIAAEQKRFIDERIAKREADEPGFADRIEIKLCDYRDVEGVFDSAASIEMGEHVGRRNYPTYAEVLHRSVVPGGHVLVQQMSRAGKGGGRHPGGGPFIESFIAPDMHMRPVGETIAMLEGSGLELRGVEAMREHYVTTVAAWLDNFESNLDRVIDLIGVEASRVWRLYLVGGAMAFRDGRMGVDQMLLRRPGGSIA